MSVVERPADRSRRRRWAIVLGLSVVVLIVVSASGFIVPVAAPQPTCDLLAPILGCKDGATPTCTRVARQARRGTTMAVQVDCPEGGGSPDALVTVGFVSTGVGVGQLLLTFGIFIASSIKHTRAARH